MFKKNKILLVTVSVLVTALLMIGIFAIVLFKVPGMLDLLVLDHYVERYHLNDTDASNLRDGILSGYIDGLDDDYAYYYNTEGTEKRSDHLHGVGNGLGVTVIKHPDNMTVYVVRVYDNSPAQKAGICPGDEIISVDGVSVLQSGYSAAVDSIKRENGTDVVLGLIHDGTESEVTVTVSDITVQSVFYEIINGYGYTEITEFTDETVVQFKNALNSLQSDGIRGLIFDLRGNGGGKVSSVGDILDELVGEGDVMTVRYKDNSTSVMLSSDSEETDLPMTVLTDGSTASAAELFSATIRDFSKGVLIGTTTYGKGVMQDTFKLSDGSTAVFTVAEFLPHSLESFNGTGLAPDIKVELTDEQIKYRRIRPLSADPVVVSAVDWLDGETR